MKTILLLILLLTARVMAGDFTLEWQPRPANEGIVEYVVYYGTADGGHFQVGTSTTTEYRVSGLGEGVYSFTITAKNVYGQEGPHSPPLVLTLPLPALPPDEVPGAPGHPWVKKGSLQASVDMQHWEEFAEVPLLALGDRTFYRMEFAAVDPE